MSSNLNVRLRQLYDVFKTAREAITGGIAEINTDHSNIHKGLGYEFGTSFTFVAGDSGVVYIGFEAPTECYAHIKNIKVQILGESVTVELLDGSDWTGGTDIPLYNLNDNSSNTATSSLALRPTVTTAGTANGAPKKILADSTNQVYGSGDLSVSENEEFVSKSENTQYMFKFTGATDTEVSIYGYYYEEPQGSSE